MEYQILIAILTLFGAMISGIAGFIAINVWKSSINIAKLETIVEQFLAEYADNKEIVFRKLNTLQNTQNSIK